MLSSQKLERIWKGAVESQSVCYPFILLEELRKKHNLFMYRILLQSERAASSIRSAAPSPLFIRDSRN
jgi:hypothetical protein